MNTDNTTTETTTAPPIGATVLGYPRIGRDRQLKRDVEGFWAGRVNADRLDQTAQEMRIDALQTMATAGLDTVPVNTFSWYDQVLDTAVMVGAVPRRFAAVAGSHKLASFDAARYFAMARGTADAPPMEMTKWFDTNYHHLVPEIGPDTVFAADPAKALIEHHEARSRGRQSRVVLVGPWTFLQVAKAAEAAPEGYDPLDRLDDLVEVYAQVLGTLAAHDVAWVQIDEPSLVRDLSAAELDRVAAVYERLALVAQRPAILVATYFGNPVEALPVLAAAPIEAIALDLTRGVRPEQVRDLPGITDKHLLLGAVDGRNIWRTDLRARLADLRAWDGIGSSRSVSTSCSLLHVPYDVARETTLDPALRDNLAFADQKVAEVVALQTAWTGDPEIAESALRASDEALARRADIAGLSVPVVAQRVNRVASGDRDRAERSARVAAQAGRLGLPVLPTTTIGSFPQTTGLRKARADLRAGRVDEAAYAQSMRDEVREVIALQERLGLDVLVHGEPERNDMVQYFAEQLAGYVATEHGWVQSYGSRCVRPPILYGDVHRPEPMTVAWASFAQSLTDRPVKGMLTGPVTMLAWSFVREDQPRQVTADQVALALRDEVVDLEAAGIAIIQVDEPALRETLPLRRAEQKQYLAWAVDSFRLATAGVRVDTQIHTHLCYSEFGEIIEAIDALNADVTSIEAARSRMKLLGDIAARGFAGAIGPGVYDIHSPRVPSAQEMAELLEAALRSVEATHLWVNPDCGLKTRGYAEVEPALEHLVAAAREVRTGLAG